MEKKRLFSFHFTSVLSELLKESTGVDIESISYWFYTLLPLFLLSNNVYFIDSVEQYGG